MSIVSPLTTLLRILFWSGQRWLPSYLRNYVLGSAARRTAPPTDVMVLVVDHYEPSRSAGPAGVDQVKEWCQSYEQIASRHADSDGVAPQHTWFYRYDYPNFECTRILSESCFRGFGEIEFHLHHGWDTPETFGRKLARGKTWFGHGGAMISADSDDDVRFGYIAGNWALCNGQMNPATSGVNNELEILADHGCYADFTFPAYGAKSQPAKINSIYYAKDNGRPRPYDSGVNVKVNGVASPDLMLVQGPQFVDWRTGYIEYGAIETGLQYATDRIDYWVNANVHVEGRPEWLFIKLHTHGMQSHEEWRSDKLDRMFGDLEARFKTGDCRLHYVTAREAYNIIKAAESGESGDANRFRNYTVPEPVNRVLTCSVPYEIGDRAGGSFSIYPMKSSRPFTASVGAFRIRAAEGTRIARLDIERNNGKAVAIKVFGSGEYELQRGDGLPEHQHCIESDEGSASCCNAIDADLMTEMPAPPEQAEAAARIESDIQKGQEAGRFKRGIKRIMVGTKFIRLAAGLARNRTVALCYHSVYHETVTNLDYIPAAISHSSVQFREQMEYIARYCNPISIDEMLQCTENGAPLPRRSVIVTFDDGYVNNLDIAVPILNATGVPGVFYVVSDSVDSDRLPWFCRTYRAFNHTGLQIWKDSVSGESWSLQTEAHWRFARSLANRRCASLTGEEQEKMVAQIERELGIPCNPGVSGIMMSGKQLRRVVDAGHQIGSHTASHPNLAIIGKPELETELKQSREKLEEVMQREVVHFSYPNPVSLYKNWNDRTSVAIREAGYKTAVVSDSGTIQDDSNRFALRRIPVPKNIDDFIWNLEYAFSGGRP